MLPCENNPKTRKELELVLARCEKCKRYANCDTVLELCDRLYLTYDPYEKIDNGNIKQNNRVV